MDPRNFFCNLGSWIQGARYKTKHVNIGPPGSKIQDCRKTSEILSKGRAPMLNYLQELNMQILSHIGSKMDPINLFLLDLGSRGA